MKKVLNKIGFKLASWLYEINIIAPQLLKKKDGSDVKSIKIMTDNELKKEYFKNELLSCLEKNKLTKNTHPYIIKGVNTPYKTKNNGIEPNIYYHHFIDLYFTKNPSLKEEVVSKNPENWNFCNIGHFISITFDNILTYTEYDYTYFDIIDLLWWFQDYLSENYIFIDNKILVNGKILIVKDINHKTEEFINEVQKTHKKHDELRNEVLNSELSDEFKTNFQKLIDSKNDVKS